jgi:hypothetical protein
VLDGVLEAPKPNKQMHGPSLVAWDREGIAYRVFAGSTHPRYAQILAAQTAYINPHISYLMQ